MPPTVEKVHYVDGVGRSGSCSVAAGVAARAGTDSWVCGRQQLTVIVDEAALDAGVDVIQEDLGVAARPGGPEVVASQHRLQQVVRIVIQKPFLQEKITRLIENWDDVCYTISSELE